MIPSKVDKYPYNLPNFQKQLHVNIGFSPDFGGASDVGSYIGNPTLDFATPRYLQSISNRNRRAKVEALEIDDFFSLLLTLLNFFTDDFWMKLSNVNQKNIRNHAKVILKYRNDSKIQVKLN